MDTRFIQEAGCRPAGLSMPVQAPPVCRSAAGTAGAGGAVSGVEASGLSPIDIARFLDIDIDTPFGHGGLHI